MLRWVFLLSLLLAWAPDALACQKYSSVVQSITGPLVPNATIPINIAGTAIPATIYSDPSCASTIANPIVSGTDATFTFYANDGHYDFGPITASGYVVNSILDVAIFEPFGNFSKSTAEFLSTQDICATTTGAIDATAGSIRTLIINTPVACTLSKTIPANISLVFAGQGSITISSGKVLTIYDPGHITAPSTMTLFAGGGTVAFTKGGQVSANWWGAKGDGSTDAGASITAALTAIGTTGGTLSFPSGTYAYATSPNFAKLGVNIVADRKTVFSHTGTGNAFILDGGATGSGLLGLRFDNLTVQGNTNSTHGFYVRSLHHSIFDHPRCLGASTTGACYEIEWAVANEWRTPRASSNELALSPIPLYGMYITRRSSDNAFSTDQTITNPVMEGITGTGGAGLYIDYGGGHKILGGTSESNYNGLVISTNSYGLNFVQTLDLEANSNKDLILEGTSNTFVNILASSSNSIGATSNPNRNTFIGGWITNLTIGANAFENVFEGTQFLTAFTDNSTVGNIYRRSTIPGGKFRPDRYGDTLFADLGTPLNGSYTYCSNCTVANPCASGGTGAFAKRLNGVWVCN